MARLSTFILRHKRLVVLFWLAGAVAGLAASATGSSRLSPQFNLPGPPRHPANQAILRAYGTGGSTLPLVAVVTPPPGTSVQAPAARQALGRAFAQLARQPGLRVVSYASTGDRRLLAADGRTSYVLVFPATRAAEMGSPPLGPPLAPPRAHAP